MGRQIRRGVRYPASEADPFTLAPHGNVIPVARVAISLVRYGLDIVKVTPIAFHRMVSIGGLIDVWRCDQDALLTVEGSIDIIVSETELTVPRNLVPGQQDVVILGGCV